jgi:hypothetical protein
MFSRKSMQKNGPSFLPQTPLGRRGATFLVAGVFVHVLTQTLITAHRIEAGGLADLTTGLVPVALYVTSVGVSAVAIFAERDRSVVTASPLVAAALVLVLTFVALIIGIP